MISVRGGSCLDAGNAERFQLARVPAADEPSAAEVFAELMTMYPRCRAGLQEPAVARDLGRKVMTMAVAD